MKKSPLCVLGAAEPENGPWRRHNKRPQQILADYFLAEAVIHISPQPSNTPSACLQAPTSPSLSSKRNPFWPSQSPKHKVFFESCPVFFLPLSLTSALKVFKLQCSMSWAETKRYRGKRGSLDHREQTVSTGPETSCLRLPTHQPSSALLH